MTDYTLTINDLITIYEFEEARWVILIKFEIDVHTHVISLCYVFVKDQNILYEWFLSMFKPPQAIYLPLFTTRLFFATFGHFSPLFSTFALFVTFFYASCHNSQFIPVILDLNDTSRYLVTFTGCPQGIQNEIPWVFPDERMHSAAFTGGSGGGRPPIFFGKWNLWEWFWGILISIMFTQKILLRFTWNSQYLFLSNIQSSMIYLHATEDV